MNLPAARMHNRTVQRALPELRHRPRPAGGGGFNPHPPVKAGAAHKRKMDKRGMEAEQQFYSMLGETVEQEMTEGQAQALIEAHWKTLPRYTKTRIRQDWEKNNLPLLQFMRPQTV